MVVSESGTIVRVIPCFEKDQKGKKTDLVKGYIVDYLTSWTDDDGFHTSLNNTYVSVKGLSDDDREFFEDIFSDCIFKSYIFSFDIRGVGGRPYFKKIEKNKNFDTTSVEV